VRTWYVIEFGCVACKLGEEEGGLSGGQKVSPDFKGVYKRASRGAGKRGLDGERVFGVFFCEMKLIY